MALKIVISDPKTGKSVQRELTEQSAASLRDMKIGDSFKGEVIDLTGFEFKITGGSDSAGFPMRKDVPGTGRKKILEVKGIGVSNKKKARGKDVKSLRTMKGMRQRVTVAGNTIYAQTAQVNVMITKAGKDDIFPKKAEAAKEGATKAEVKPAEQKAEEKAEKKTEAPKEEKKEEKHKAEKKEEKKTEEKKHEAKKEEKAEKQKEEKPKEKPADKKEKPKKEEKK